LTEEEPDTLVVEAQGDSSILKPPSPEPYAEDLAGESFPDFGDDVSSEPEIEPAIQSGSPPDTAMVVSDFNETSQPGVVPDEEDPTITRQRSRRKMMRASRANILP
jgi:hypothetical protein